MAIRIDGLPGGPVYVDNAAEESTLQELLRVMGAQTTRQRRTDADQSAALKRSAAAADEAAASMSGVAGAARSAASSTSGGWSKLESGLNAATIAAEDFKNSQLGTEMQRLATTLADAGITWTKSIKSINADYIGSSASLFATSADLAGAGLKGLSSATTGVLDLLGPLGVALGKAGNTLAASIINFSVGGLKLVNSVLSKELSETIKNMNTFNKMGASFAGGFMELRNIANDSGLTIEQFTEAVSKAEQSIRQFGMPFGEAARKVSEVSKAFETTVVDGRSLRDQLRALGYNTEEQIELAAEYMAMQRIGMSAEKFRNLQAEDVARATKAYAVDLKVLQDITGKNAKAAVEEARARSMQADVLAKFTDPEQRKKFEAYFATIPAHLKKGFLQKMAGEIVTDQATNIAMTQVDQIGKMYQTGFDIIYDGNKTVEEARREGMIQTIRTKNATRDFVKQNGAIIPMVNTLTGAYSDVTAIFNDLTGGLVQTEDAVDKSYVAANQQANASDELTTGILNAQNATQKFANQVEKIALDALPAYAKAIGDATGTFVGILDTSIRFLTNKPLEGRTQPQTFEQYRLNVEELLKEFVRRQIPSVMQAPGMERRAAGGPVNAGVPYLVGENGPEIRTFDQSGYIVPLDRIAGSLATANMTDQLRQAQEMFTQLARSQKESLQKIQTAQPDLEPIRELPAAVSQAIEIALAGPKGLNQAITDLKTQLADDNANNKQMLEQQIDELQKIVSAMRDNLTYSERIANELA